MLRQDQFDHVAPVHTNLWTVCINDHSIDVYKRQHGNSAATTDQTCMMGGICVAQDMRKKGYAKEILHTLCEEIRRQGKIPCIFSPEKEQYSIFEELGFEKYGRWGIAKV